MLVRTAYTSKVRDSSRHACLRQLVIYSTALLFFVHCKVYTLLLAKAALIHETTQVCAGRRATSPCKSKRRPPKDPAQLKGAIIPEE